MPGTLVAKRVSTMTRPLLSVFTPTASRPSPSVNGTRPIDTSTTSASIDSAAPPAVGWTIALLFEDALDLSADLAIHSRQDAVEELDHDHLGAETAPHRTELKPDHAGADDE